MRSHRRRKHRNAARPVEPRGVRGTPSTVPTNGQEEQYPLGVQGSTGPCSKQGRARVTQAREFIGTAEHAAVTKRSSFGRNIRPLSRATTCGGKAITMGLPRGMGSRRLPSAEPTPHPRHGERNSSGASRPWREVAKRPARRRLTVYASKWRGPPTRAQAAPARKQNASDRILDARQLTLKPAETPRR